MKFLLIVSAIASAAFASSFAPALEYGAPIVASPARFAPIAPSFEYGAPLIAPSFEYGAPVIAPTRFASAPIVRAPLPLAPSLEYGVPTRAAPLLTRSFAPIPTAGDAIVAGPSGTITASRGFGTGDVVATGFEHGLVGRHAVGLYP